MRIALLLALALLAPRAASAQAAASDTSLAKAPIGPLVVDVRAAFPRLPQDEAIAAGIGVTAGNLPSRGFGLVVGAHVYPVRGRSVALGLGGEFLFSRRARTLEATTEGGTEGPTVNGAFSAISPQVSVNFGGRDGWSYLSGGVGWARYTAERADAPLADSGPYGAAINYGGGARWYASRHLAISLDLRFHRVNATEPSGSWPGTPQFSSMTISAGVGLR